MYTPVQKLAAESLGTAFLLAIVVGSGLMAERLFPGQTGLALLANALATGAGLYALIVSLGPVSGAHFNPLVSLWAACIRQLSWTQAGLYGLAQLGGAGLGVMMAHAMFDLPLLAQATQSRPGAALWFSEGVATFGLLMVIIGTQQRNPQHTPAAVATYILAAYWFTASTSFANPAVTLARSLTDSFAGIALGDVGGFVLAQGVGALAAIGLCAKGLRAKAPSAPPLDVQTRGAGAPAPPPSSPASDRPR